jgi:hypothetical protein
MSVSITDHSGMLNEAIQRHAERRFLFALSRFDSRIKDLQIELTVEKSSQGRAEFCCHVNVDLLRATEVRLSESAGEPIQCITRAADKAGRAVKRSIDRAYDLHRNRTIAMNAGVMI